MRSSSFLKFNLLYHISRFRLKRNFETGGGEKGENGKGKEGKRAKISPFSAIQGREHP
jgi:hypothetical protein